VSCVDVLEATAVTVALRFSQDNCLLLMPRPGRITQHGADFVVVCAKTGKFLYEVVFVMFVSFWTQLRCVSLSGPLVCLN